jgi:hypothetical protein
MTMERTIQANCITVVHPPCTNRGTTRLNGTHYNGQGAIAVKARRETRRMPENESRPRPAPNGAPHVFPRPVNADQPDARPRRLDTAVRASAHAVVLASVVGFVLFYCVWSPLRGRWTAAFESATVMTVADPLTEVRAPDVTGVFRAERQLPNGTTVRKGQLLGTIDAPQVTRDLERAARELRTLQFQQLQFEEEDQQQRLTDSGWDREQEARAIAGRVEDAISTLEQLHAVRRKLPVYAPVDGFVQHGLPSTADVAPQQKIVSVYPRGADLLIEVTAPLEALNALQQRGRVVAEFATPGGKVKVSCAPNFASLRPFKRTTGRGTEEIWGVLQCTPTAPIPDETRLPGLLGRVGS